MTLLAGSIFHLTASVNNIAAVGGSLDVTAVESPQLLAAGMPVFAKIALAVPMTPKPQGFVVGARFSDWVEHGFLYVDEESKVSLPNGATVKAEQ
jgi:hypothetical protein